MGWLDWLFGILRIRELQGELAQVKAEKEHLAEEFKRCFTQKTQLKESHDSLSSSYEELSRQLEAKKAEVTKLSADLIVVKALLEEIQRRSDESATLLAELQKTEAELDRAVKALSQEKATAIRLLNEKEKELDELRAKVQELEGKLPKPMPQPKILGEITTEQANKLLREILTPKPDPYARDPYWFSDPSYKLTTVADIKAFLQASKISELSYVAHDLDCDDFAAGLHGEFSITPGWEPIAHALVWGNFPGLGPHAWNLVIAYPREDLKIPLVYFIEPQTDQLWEVAEKSFEGLSMWLVVM